MFEIPLRIVQYENEKLYFVYKTIRRLNEHGWEVLMKTCFRNVKGKFNVSHDDVWMLIIKLRCRKSSKIRQLYRRLGAFHGQSQETSEIEVSAVLIIVICCL